MYLQKTAFDALVAIGFHFDETDVIVLDETNEPALKGLSTTYYTGQR